MQTRDLSPDDVAAAVDRLCGALGEQERRSALALGLGSNDARMLRHLIGGADGVVQTPASIARYLGISSASVTALIDRLEAMSLVERVSHPTDRRSVTVRATVAAGSDVERLLSEPMSTVRAASEVLAPGERDVVARFLNGLADRLD